MKRLFKGLTVCSLAAALAISAAACGDVVKNGSKIQNLTVTLAYYEDGEQVTRDVNFELYLNFAPATIEHVKYLAENGYYDGTVVSNLSSYFEFGAYSSSDGSLVSKYEATDAKGYKSIISQSYVTGKNIGPSGSLARYVESDGIYNIYGEFAENGIGGNKLALTGGALVLKRDYSDDTTKSYYNTGKATLAVTFTTGTYFDSASKFAIIGKIVSDDAENFSDEKSSYKFISDLMNDYKSDDDGNTYYYYTYESDDEANAAAIAEYGRYFMKDDDGKYFYKDADGNYTSSLDEETDKDLIKELKEKSVYLLNLPYSEITVKSVKVG